MGTVGGDSMRCPRCDGKGTLDLTEAEVLAAGVPFFNEDDHQGHEDCDRCNGTGHVSEVTA